MVVSAVVPLSPPKVTQPVVDTSASGNGPIQAAAEANIGSFTDAELQTVLADGLTIWRAQRIDINGINKGACANCHSADGLELALWEFDDVDIVRRAHIDGVNAADQAKLVQYFAALRQKYKVTTLRSVADDRPFQPGGNWFTGTFNERDAQFAAQSLAREYPTLMGPPIITLAAARQAIAEVRNSNPLKVKVGIEMPRMSADCFRGGEECTLDDWMSDLPRFPVPASEAAWYQLNDEYIANPTDAGLRKLLSAVDSMTTSWKNPGEATQGPAGNLGTIKFKSMQVLQHFLRMQQLGKFTPQQGDNLSPLAAVIGKRDAGGEVNYPFIVGDIAFNKTLGNLRLKEAAHLPLFVRKSLGETATQPLTNEALEADKARVRMPWWWVGFIMDPGLNLGGTGGEYFLQNLVRADEGGLPFHQLYAATRTAADGGYRAQTGTDYSLHRLPTHDVAVGPGDNPEFFDRVVDRQAYRRASVNWARTVLLLTQDRLMQAGPAALDRFAAKPDGYVCFDKDTDRLPAMVLSAANLDGTSARFLFELYNDIRVRAGCATNLRPTGYVAGPGGGLKVEWFSTMDYVTRKTGNKLGERTEPIMDFSSQSTARGYVGAYRASIGAVGNAASRSSGYLHVPLTGTYIFGTRTDLPARLWVDGKLVYDYEQRATFEGNRINPGVTLQLQAGAKVSIVFERYNVANSGIHIAWKLAGQSAPMRSIPSSQLSPE